MTAGFRAFGAGPVGSVKVLGDRSSGTNFVEALIRRNLPTLAEDHAYGWKHGFVDRRLSTRPGALTVVVYRHPIRWLQSLHRRPHDVSAAMTGLSFSAFIRAEWRPAWIETTPDGAVIEHAIQGDMYPRTTRRFENVLRMRATKIAYLEEMATMGGAVAYARYEDVNADPQRFVARLAKAYGAARPGAFEPVRDYKGEGRRQYQPAARRRPAGADMAFIRAELDEGVEAAIGYDPAAPPPGDGLRWTDPRRLGGAIRGVLKAG